MGVPPGTRAPAPSFVAKHWKALLASGCAGLFLAFCLLFLIIGAWLIHRRKATTEAVAEPLTPLASEEEESGRRIEERVAVLDRPPPAFLRSKGGNRPPAGPPAEVPEAIKPAVLTAVDAKAADVETRFMGALLVGDVNGAMALAGPQLKGSGGAGSLRLFAALSADHGGGSFAPEKAAQLPDGATATTGRVSYKDGTSAKVTVLSVDGKVDGFTAR